MDLLRLERDLFRFIAYALQIIDRAHHGHHHAQIAGGRLTAHDDVSAEPVDVHLHAVDPHLVVQDLCGELGIVRAQSLYRAYQLALD